MIKDSHTTPYKYPSCCYLGEKIQLWHIAICSIIMDLGDNDWIYELSTAHVTNAAMAVHCIGEFDWYFYLSWILFMMVFQRYLFQRNVKSVNLVELNQTVQYGSTIGKSHLNLVSSISDTRNWTIFVRRFEELLWSYLSKVHSSFLKFG